MATSWQTIDWATTWSGVTSLLTLGLLVATGVYARLTYRLVASAERQTLEISRPRMLISVSAIQGGQLLVLNVENIGLSSAEQLALALDRPVHQSYGQLLNLQDYKIFSGLAPALPPKAISRYGLGIGWLAEDLDRDLHPLQFNVTATYKFGGRAFEDVFQIDIQAQFSKSLLDADYIQQFGQTFPKEFSRFRKELVAAVEALYPSK
jgi:hypothetical protein